MTISTEWLKERLKNPRSGTEFELITEVLANREAQPVAEVLSSRAGNDTSTIDKALPDGTKLYTAPPAPAVPTPVNFSENADADMCRKWAWEQVKELVSTDGWTLGDNITYFGFFCWGWDMRRQYNEQRPPVVNPEFTVAPAVPEDVRQALRDMDDEIVAELDTEETACRAAMLAQPVSQGYTLPEKWVACSEQMPELDKRVLLYFGSYSGHIEDGCIGDDGDGPYHYFFDGDSLQQEPTHWMPCPAAPEGGNG